MQSAGPPASRAVLGECRFIRIASGPHVYVCLFVCLFVCCFVVLKRHRLRKPHLAHTNETKRFPSWGCWHILTPNLRHMYIHIYIYISIYDTTPKFQIQLVIWEGPPGRRHLGGCIWEGASARRHLGRGIWKGTRPFIPIPKMCHVPPTSFTCANTGCFGAGLRSRSVGLALTDHQ